MEVTVVKGTKRIRDTERFARLPNQITPVKKI